MSRSARRPPVTSSADNAIQTGHVRDAHPSAAASTSDSSGSTDADADSSGRWTTPSAPTTPPSSNVSGRNRTSGSTSCMSPRGCAERDRRGESRSGVYTRTPPRADFAAYMAASANRSRSVTSSAWSGVLTTPMLAPTRTRTPATVTGRHTSSWIRTAQSRASSRATPGSRAANSSPPRRARTSVGRNAGRIRSPSSCSNWSPAWWPTPSLTALNPSRSSSRSAAGRPVRSCWPSRSISARRFGRPVRSSVAACSRISCSERSSWNVTAVRMSAASRQPSALTSPTLMPGFPHSDASTTRLARLHVRGRARVRHPVRVRRSGAGSSSWCCGRASIAAAPVSSAATTQQRSIGPASTKVPCACARVSSASPISLKTKASASSSMVRSLCSPRMAMTADTRASRSTSVTG